MKLLVLAQTPPPVHGQSLMVRALLDGFAARGIPTVHVDLGLSRSIDDIGRWRVGKGWRAIAAALRAAAHALAGRSDTLYYVPAPAKRGALYRDWIILLICRPFFRRVVLHWQAAGLGEWVQQNATIVERAASKLLLGGADLSVVLGQNLRADAEIFSPRQVVVLRNGIADPCPDFRPAAKRPAGPLRTLFIGICSREKGVLTAAAAVTETNRRQPGSATLTVAGEFPDRATAQEFAAMAKESGGALRHVGFVQGAVKYDVFAHADVLIFPTCYAHETQGLVVAEALAFDLPVIVTRWRAVHEGLPDRHVYLVEPSQPAQIADALFAVRAAPPPAGALRAHFLEHFTQARYLDHLEAALHAIDR